LTALRARARAYQEARGHHVGYPLLVATLLAQAYAPEALDEITQALEEAGLD
jgi:hypothetical protein